MARKVAWISDFDNSWTNALEEVVPALSELYLYLSNFFGMHLDDVNLEMVRHVNTLRESSFEGMVSESKDGARVTAPASSSVFYLYTNALENFFGALFDVKKLYQLACMYVAGVDEERFTSEQVYRVLVIKKISSRILQKSLERFTLKERTCFRPDIEDTLSFALDCGIDVAVITNSPEEVVRRKIATRVSLTALVARMERNGKRIIGSAKKWHVDFNWNGVVDANGVSRIVPEKENMKFLARDVYLRRRAYAEVLQEVGFFDVDAALTFGDCVENDLLLPYHCGSYAALMEHDYLPYHERMWANNSDDVDVVTSMREVQMLLAWIVRGGRG